MSILEIPHTPSGAARKCVETALDEGLETSLLATLPKDDAKAASLAENLFKFLRDSAIPGRNRPPEADLAEADKFRTDLPPLVELRTVCHRIAAVNAARSACTADQAKAVRITTTRVCDIVHVPTQRFCHMA